MSKGQSKLPRHTADCNCSDAPEDLRAEALAKKDGWSVTVTRGPRVRSEFPSNIDKRDAAVAELKRVCIENRLRVWGTYQTQKSRLHYTHDDPACSNFGTIYERAAGKIARGQLACGCKRQAAASRRSLGLVAAADLAKQRGGELLSSSYRNNSTLLHWKCMQGHPFFMSQSDVRKGRWCPDCGGSRANAMCKAILDVLLAVQFKREQTPAFLARASKEAGLVWPLRFDGWCEAEKIAFEHQGPQHEAPIVRNLKADGSPDIETARKSFLLGKKYDAIKTQACKGHATLILIPDISVPGYGFAQSKTVLNTIVSAVRAALPAARLGEPFETAVNAIAALDAAGWQQLIQPVFAGSSRIARLREFVATKGGRVVAVIDQNRAIFECAQGHRWPAQINNVFNGNWRFEGIARRAQSRRLPIAELKARLEAIGLRLDWTDAEAQANYRNNLTPIPVVRVACGGRISRPLAKLHMGSRCEGCKGRRECVGKVRSTE